MQPYGGEHTSTTSTLALGYPLRLNKLLHHRGAALALSICQDPFRHQQFRPLFIVTTAYNYYYYYYEMYIEKRVLYLK